MAIAADLPAKRTAVAGGVVGSAGDRSSTENAGLIVPFTQVGINFDPREVPKSAVKNLFLFMEVAQQEGQVRTTRIEGPVVIENALKRILKRWTGGAVVKQETGFSLDQFHGERNENERRREAACWQEERAKPERGEHRRERSEGHAEKGEAEGDQQGENSEKPKLETVGVAEG